MPDFNLEIVSPQGLVLQCPCSLVVLPSVSGDLGIMRSHESIIAILKEGKILVYNSKQSLINELNITSGFAEMYDAEKLLVLVDEVI